MTTATTKIVAASKWTGSYGNTASARVVRRGQQTYLVIDQWCAENHLGGFCYREHVYVVPVGLRQSVAKFVADPNGELGHMTNIEYLEKYTLAQLQFVCRIGQLPWTNEL